MSTAGKTVLFLIKLPFRIVVIPIAILISVAGITVNIITNLGGGIIGLFNLTMILAFFGIIVEKDWNMLWSLMAVFVFEGFIIFLGVAVQVLLISISDKLWSFVATN